MTCSGPDCDRPSQVSGLCLAHYRQDLRGNPLQPLRDPKPSSQVTFRCPTEIKAKAERAAARAGIDPAEWWRRAGLIALERKR